MKKLSDPIDAEKEYKIRTGDDLLRASFIGLEEIPDWRNSVPQKEGFNRRYLAQEEGAIFEEYQSSREALLRAITHRLVALYKHWYVELHVAQLF